jgi:thioredoxin 1
MKIEVLKFETDSCVPCKSMKPSWERAIENYPSYTFTVVDCSSDLSKATKFGVRSVPTFVILEDGREVDRVTGANPQTFFDALNRWL